MKDLINQNALHIYNSLRNAGYESYFVGGCVRNLLMNIPVTDWDITTNATPEEIQKIFPNSFYDNVFGTVGVKYNSYEEGDIGYAEVTTYRTERGYDDFRHPGEVKWGKTLQEDITRRDFTINALALELVNNQPKIIDFVNGQQDLKAKLIRAVGDPDKRFKEDALRMLRAIRFCAQIGFGIEEKTFSSIKNDAKLINNISKERIREELLKILSSNDPYRGIMKLDEAGLLQFIIPELTEGKGISQERPGRHHTTDVFTHNLLSMKECPSKDPIVKFAALLHDIGKPKVASKDSEGYVVFYNHEVVGARIAKDIAMRLRFSKKESEKIYTLIRWHMFTVDENITDSAVRRFIRRVGVENVKDMIDLRIGDRLGGGTQTAESWRLKKFKERLEEQLNPPFSINDLAIDGNDVMEKLNLPPSKRVGEILQILFEEVDEDMSKNDREYLLKRLEEFRT